MSLLLFPEIDESYSALQEQIDRLADNTMLGGERSDAVDHCLAGIARLSSEVKDASSYIPTYDQRVYAEVCDRYLRSTKISAHRPTYVYFPLFSYTT